MLTALRILLLVGCSALHAGAFSLTPASPFSVATPHSARIAAVNRMMPCVASIRMRAGSDDSAGKGEQAIARGRREATFSLAAAITALAMPQAAPAQGLAGLRKRITGEADGEERAAVRRKKDAQFNACETYQCIEPNSNTMGGTLARVQLGELSVLAPTKWAQEGGSGDVLASWKDGTGSAVTVTKQATADSGLAWKRIPVGTIPAMAKSIVDYDIVSTGSKLAKLKGEGVEYTGAKARYLKNDGVVMYTVGLKSEAEIEVVDVLLTDDFVYKIAVSAPANKWQDVKAFLSEILASPSLQKAAA